MQTGPQPYAEFFVRVGDKDFYGIDWQGWLEHRWASDTDFTLIDVVRPTKANGYEFACTVAGLSAADEPIWPTTLAATIADGSAIWTCQAPSVASLTSTLASAVWSPPAGIAISNQSLVDQRAMAMFDMSGASVGQEYIVNCAATMVDGEVKNGQIKFKVR